MFSGKIPRSVQEDHAPCPVPAPHQGRYREDRNPARGRLLPHLDLLQGRGTSLREVRGLHGEAGGVQGSGGGGSGGVPVNPISEERDGEESDCLIALERFQDRDDLIISSEDLKKRLA